ncbi:ABC transporter ATP-binding protein [Paraburkholderia sp. MMS20-SJTR3]|uniref:ABC transporter ATP-binding protein n=1 Tax=Paraburkholderia sejongensis TaxID=2886946 RepID=A0ABS8JRH2_9BURK|nr:ABC transporter ATP-binding protein [Paraburkholderia sp. MMS20-SJTR3]MCC8392494.1 ABC transporter ATP-binding protein [Paraburkholderia sp. MMS20-SJTR3]
MAAARLLEASSLAVSWRQTSVALHDVSLHVDAGEIVVLLGGNGAGKTTTLKAISRLLHAERGELTAGRIAFRGVDVARDEPWRVVERGLAQVLEGRRCFAHLSVEENLRLGGFVRRGRRAQLEADLDRIYAIFPRLKLRRRLQAGYMSGGEQQMLAIGRALMAKPTLVLLDEPSMGLAPQIVDEIFEIVAALNRDGVSFLLAEQNAAVALRYAHRGYVLESGTVVTRGSTAQLRDLDTLRDAYLGRAAQRDEERVS